ncbi:MAG: phasin family protein [Pseudomonadota bacterium]
MSTFNENLEAFAEFQKQGFEPFRQFTNVAVESLETLARKNYAVAGDVLEFAVTQAKLPVEATEPKDLFEQHIAATREFAELLSSRASEYVELSKSFQEKASELVTTETKPAPRKSKKAA